MFSSVGAISRSAACCRGGSVLSCVVLVPVVACRVNTDDNPPPPGPHGGVQGIFNPPTHQLPVCTWRLHVEAAVHGKGPGASVTFVLTFALNTPFHILLPIHVDLNHVIKSLK